MENSTLRDLASAYARGKISRAEYLESRSRLIQTLTGAVSADAPPVETPVSATEAASPAPPPAGRHLRVDALAAIAALFGLALGLYWYFQPAPQEETPIHISPGPVTAEPGTRRLKEFLHTNSWNPATERQLLADWEALGKEAQGQAKNTPAYRQIQDTLYQAVLEEQALAELDDGTSDYRHLRGLLDLAEGLDLKDSTFSEARAWLERQHASQRQKATLAVESESTAAAPAPAGQAKPVTKQASAPGSTAPPRQAPHTVTGRPTSAATTEAPAAAPPKTRPAVSKQQETTATDTPPQTGQVKDATPVAAPASPTAPGTGSTNSPSPEATAKTIQSSAGKPPHTATATGGKNTGKTRRNGCSAKLARTRKPYCRDSIQGDGRGPLMVVLPAGSFTMGGERPTEQPRHEVKLPSAFAMSLYEISQRQFARYCASSGRSCPPQPWSDQDLPVVNVSWHEAMAYCQWLSRQTGRHYRLPVEAEWEYAARAGARGRYPGGDELLPTQARFSYQTPLDRPLPLGDHSVNRNRFRLYHMLGNVREWVLDSWHGNYQGAPQTARVFSGDDDRHVIRGGSYHDRAGALTLASRLAKAASSGDRYTGFRIVQSFTGSRDPARLAEEQAWLAAQRPDMLTLQLFAGRNIQTMKGLIDSHRELDIHILPAGASSVNYRVIYGIFPDRQQARDAFAQLPEELSRLAGKPIIKTVADLQAKR